MQKLIYVNQKGEKLEMGYSGQIILEHLNLGEVDVLKQGTRGIGQDGIMIHQKNLGIRVLEADCCIIGESEKDRFDIRRKIGQILNPNFEGYLIYNNGFKDFRIASGLNVSISFGEMFGDRKIQRFEASFYCPDPYFNDLEEHIKTFLEITPRLSFPLKIRVPGFIFSSLAGGELELENMGDASAPIKILIEGPVLNPGVTNLTTDESIKINYDLKSNEKIEITTYFANKRVTIIDENGGKTNGMHYLDTSRGISFFSLKPGRNMLKFSADIGADLGRMKVYFSPKYLIV